MYIEGIPYVHINILVYIHILQTNSSIMAIGEISVPHRVGQQLRIPAQHKCLKRRLRAVISGNCHFRKSAIGNIRYNSINTQRAWDWAKHQIRIFPGKLGYSLEQTLTLYDNGIGMAKNGLTSSLEANAMPCTKAFMEAEEDAFVL